MKVNIGPVNGLYPSLTTIVGLHVDGKPNFLAIAHVGIMNHGQPQYISIGVNRAHHSCRGIHENGCYSVCVPSESLVRETDYVGIVSGKNTDKAELFDVFYGSLPAAPMIGQCPLCMECRVGKVVPFEAHDVFIAEIVATHVDESALKNGKIDIAAIRPLLFDMNSLKYWALGGEVAQCWGVGKELKKERAAAR